MKKEKTDVYDITVLQKNKEVRHISCPADLNLLDAMRKHGIRLISACGGNGFCGKCRIRLLSGELKPGPQEAMAFTQEELALGWHLACMVYPAGNCVIEITDMEEDFAVITEHRDTELKNNYGQSQETRQAGNEIKDHNLYAIAVDIGTSTVVLSLVNIKDGKTLMTYSAINPQRAYGADVIARIQAASSGNQKILQELIRAELLRGICYTVEKAGIDKSNICKLVIACNTVMGHLLLGYSCEGLGRYPYTPVNISGVELTFSQAFNSDYLDAPVAVMPGISTFVGGDILAGLLSCDIDKSDKICLLIDLGTNGEMALGNKDRLLVTSTAAGPAFEGGNISCGTGSIAGAVCSLDIIDGKTSYRTIQDKEAVGLCGTGIIELTSELLRTGLIDETGLLAKQYFKEGFPIKDSMGQTIFRFTQKDIRQLQMAKAAIRAGIDILIKEYGISYDDIDKVFLAGGFGFRLNLQKAVNIGLLPKELYARIIPAGNSALGGAITYLLDCDAPLRAAAIINAAKELQLSEYAEFNSLYPEYMYFK